MRGVESRLGGAEDALSKLGPAVALGMRGVVTLAIALSVPGELPGRNLILVAAFAAILVTVLGQGTTIGWVIDRGSSTCRRCATRVT